MKTNIYLNFYGNCAEALAFYEEVFETKAAFVQTYGNSPIEVAENNKEKIIHATLMVGETLFMFSDLLEGSAVVGNVLEINLAFTDLDEQKKIFDALSSGGEVTMALEKQFWGDTFGKLTDKFGIRWMANATNGEVKRDDINS